MEFLLESGVRNNFRVRYGVWSSNSYWSLESRIVLESGMEFVVRFLPRENFPVIFSPSENFLSQ